MSELMLKYFREKQQEVETEKVYNAQCPFCSMQCKKQVIEQTIVTRKKYRTIGVDNPTTGGRLCVKGLNAYQHAFHEDRLRYPMQKIDGVFQRISWEEAMRLIKEKVPALQKEYGKDTVGVYGGGSLTNETSYVLGKFARLAVGTKYIDYNGRFCMSAAASAGNKALGIDRGLTNQLDEIPESKCIILAGTNIADCQPTIMPYFEEAKRNGAYIIVIDPRETATAQMADLHLKVKPGCDNAAANAMLKCIYEEGKADMDFVEKRTEGAEDLFAHLQNLTMDACAEESAIPLQQLEKAARAFANAESGMIFTARGIEQQIDGYLAVRNFINMLLLTGKIGKKGSGYGAVTGQGNGQGGREHGQKADQLPGYRSIENKEDRQYIADIWGMQEKDLPGKGVSAYEMMELIGQGEIKSLFLVGSNPIVSNPHATMVKKAIQSLDFFVAVDMFISETAEYADLILPAASYMENAGTLTNLEGRVTLREADKKAPGESRNDWDILSMIAGALGCGQQFPYQSAEEIFDELRLASKGGAADYFGITYERIRQEEGVFWPCRSEADPGTRRLFEDKFAREGGRAELLAVPLKNENPKEEVSQSFPLYLTTGRVMAHYLTGVQTRKSSNLNARLFESFIEIHPVTAERYAIAENTLVNIESPRGKITVRSRLSEQIREDTVFVPFHWAENQNVNMLVEGRLDPVCRMPGFKRSAVRVSPYQEQH